MCRRILPWSTKFLDNWPSPGAMSTFGSTCAGDFGAFITYTGDGSARLEARARYEPAVAVPNPIRFPSARTRVKHGGWRGLTSPGTDLPPRKTVVAIPHPTTAPFSIHMYQDNSLGRARLLHVSIFHFAPVRSTSLAYPEHRSKCPLDCPSRSPKANP